MKRLGYVFTVLGAVISIGFNIRAIYELTQFGLPTNAWTAIGLALFFVGIFALVHYRNPNIQHLSVIARRDTPTPIKNLTTDDEIIIDNLIEQMRNKHDYTDDSGIKKDYQKGIDPDVILSRKCSVCGLPRNEKGEIHTS
jgi:hypothetical protein